MADVEKLRELVAKACRVLGKLELTKSGSGHISARDWESYEGARIETYDLITLTAECEAP